MSESHLFLKALRGEPVERPPVWMMRQAGRYLPEYMRLRAKYDFFTRIQTPELACEITLQPIDIVGPDAAILFSDILVIPQALGMEVQMVEGKGPVLPQTIQTERDLKNLQLDGAADRLQYVYDAIKLTRRELRERVPLIGFSGAPFTLLCYMVEGKGSKAFDLARQFCVTQPLLAHQLLETITEVSIEYLQRQVEAGAQAVQIFDSWSGLLSAADFDRYCLPYLTQITYALKDRVPVILFAKGSWYALEELSRTGASALGLDWCVTPEQARNWTGGRVTLQGNFDPAKLHLPPEEIHREVHRMIDAFGVQKYIANLGHGITPKVPVENARAFVDAVKTYVPQKQEA